MKLACLPCLLSAAKGINCSGAEANKGEPPQANTSETCLPVSLIYYIHLQLQIIGTKCKEHQKLNDAESLNFKEKKRSFLKFENHRFLNFESIYCACFKFSSNMLLINIEFEFVFELAKQYLLCSLTLPMETGRGRHIESLTELETYSLL